LSSPTPWNRCRLRTSRIGQSGRALATESAGAPSRRVKLFFWVLLGSFSVFFTEVVSGSDMFPFFHPWGLLVILPLYTLHIVVLSSIVLKRGNVRFSVLFLAGAIFGMYEAYVTKVLWSPTWGAPMVSVGGLALMETIVLVLWWHPFMAFVVPLFVAETMLTGSSQVFGGLPGRVQRLLAGQRTRGATVLLFGLLCGAFQSHNSPSILQSLLSGLLTTVLISALAWFWRTRTVGREYTIDQLLPGRRELLVLSLLLAAGYVITGVVIRPDALPGLESQLIVWMIYAGLFGLLFLGLRRLPGERACPAVIAPRALGKLWPAFALVFTLTSAACGLLPASWQSTFLLISWAAGGVLGIARLCLAVRRVLGGA